VLVLRPACSTRLCQKNGGDFTIASLLCKPHPPESFCFNEGGMSSSIFLGRRRGHAAKCGCQPCVERPPASLAALSRSCVPSISPFFTVLLAAGTSLLGPRRTVPASRMP
jgi:hypothetical protein